MDRWMSIELRCVCCGREVHVPQVWRYMLCAGEVVGIANRTTFQKSRGQDRL